MTAKDIKRWALDDDPARPNLGLEFEEDTFSCSSIYGLCDVEEKGTGT